MAFARGLSSVHTVALLATCCRRDTHAPLPACFRAVGDTLAPRHFRKAACTTRFCARAVRLLVASSRCFFEGCTYRSEAIVKRWKTSPVVRRQLCRAAAMNK